MRECGTCTACCTLMGVEELSKSPGTACDKLTCAPFARGCSIYNSRPNSCREFQCLWLQDDEGQFTNNMERPDRVGVMLDVGNPDSDVAKLVKAPPVIARAYREGALEDRNAMKLLKRIARKVLVVIVRDGKERRLIGPEHMVRRASNYLIK